MGFSRFIAIARLVLQRRQVNGRSFNQGQFRRWTVGGARITKVVEMVGEGFGEFLLPAAQRGALSRIAWLDPGHLGPRGGLKLSVHSFVVEIGGARVLIDTNVGNGKKRRVPIWNKLSMPWLDDLQRAGFAPESIDIVICTHIHIDHVGWNTIQRDGTWVPTFPNARYVFVREEFDYWRARLDDPARAELFADSITPVVAARQVQLVEPGTEIVPGLRLIATPGHTEFHVSVAIESEGETALITGDAFHHPAQIAHPEWSSTFDTSPETSVRTRQQLLSRLASERTLVLGTAFPDPSAGYIVGQDGNYSFEVVPAS